MHLSVCFSQYRTLRSRYVGETEWLLSATSGHRRNVHLSRYGRLAPTVCHARSMQVSKLRLNSEDEPSPLRLNDPSSLTISESGTSVDSAYFASASTIQAAEALAHCSMRSLFVRRSQSTLVEGLRQSPRSLLQIYSCSVSPHCFQYLLVALRIRRGRDEQT